MKRGELDSSLLGDRSVGVLLMAPRPLAVAPMVAPRAGQPSGDDADWAVAPLTEIDTAPACVRLVEDRARDSKRDDSPDVRRRVGGIGAVFQRVILEFSLF
jgi:hypothetical protein